MINIFNMKKLLTYLFLFAITHLAVFSQNVELRHVIEQTKNTYVPDTRVCVFNVEVKETDKVPAVYGEISDKTVYDKLLSSFQNASLPFNDSIRLLPDKSKFGEKFWSFVPSSVIYIYSKPLYSAEIVSQALLGTPVKLLDKTKYGWYQIQTPDGYIGWTESSFVEISEQQRKELNSKERLIVTVHNTFLYEKKSRKSSVVADLVMGNLVTLAGKYTPNDYCEVILPDGRKGFVSSSETALFSEWKKTIRPTGNSLVKLSKEFIGLPYFWGGTSVRGMDCSGFMKTIYFMHGIILPRDASQQFFSGDDVDISTGVEKLQIGDLLFFGRKNEANIKLSKIGHVGMYIGNNQFIHSSDLIHISSFDPAQSNYDEGNYKRFVGAKRIIGAKPSNFWSIFDHEWYK